jgi:signal transduction histidine kinase
MVTGSRKTGTNKQKSLFSYFRFGWPILGLMILVCSSVFFLLADIAREQDRTYKTTTRDFVKQASKTWVNTNAAISDEYGLWNDAYSKVTLSFDQDWAERNYFSGNVDALGIVSRPKGLRYTYLDEAVAPRAEPIKSFLRQVDLSAHDAYQREPSDKTLSRGPVGLVIIDGKLAALAAQPIRPEGTFDGIKPNANLPIDVTIAVKFIDQAALELLSQSYQLKDVKLHIGKPPVVEQSDRIHFVLTGIDGQTLAWLDWVDVKPGSASFSKRVLPILSGLIFLCLLASVITRWLVGHQVKMSDDARTSAEEASKTKSAFLASVSHELCTPLNAIIGYTEIVGEDCAASGASESAEDCKKVLRSAHHLLGLINDLLDHSKIEAGKMDLNPHVTPLLPVFEGVGDALSSLMVKNKTEFILNCDPEIGEAFLDGMRLKQCLLNLVSNAAKFTMDGKITLSARGVDFDGQSHLRISVKDTGMGMNEATLAKLFHPFVQADETTASRFGGTGLGLVITRALVEAMGGQISVESAVGQGSIFTILVPRGMVAAGTTKSESLTPLAA